MKVVIVEDEILAAEELIRMLKNYSDDIEILASIKSVKEALINLPKLEFDLLFLDISLPDGQSFEILDAVNLNVPIIFTTAYDEYAIKAFKYNSIDYLLKPIDQDDLNTALQKFDRQSTKDNTLDFEAVSNLLKNKTKSRFLIKKGDNYTYINIDEIAYFYSEDKYTFIRSNDGKNAITEHSLNEVENTLDNSFFRVSRNMICHISSVDKASKYFNSRLQLELKPPFATPVLISRKRVASFLDWLDQ